MHVQSRWAANLNLSVCFFLRFSLPLPSSLLQLCISKRKSLQTDTWCQYCQRESCLYLEYDSAGYRPWDKGGGEGLVIQTLRKGGGEGRQFRLKIGGSPSLRNKRFQSSHIAWKLERKQKNGWRGRGEEVPSFPSPSPVIHVFFALVPAF